MVTCGKGSLCYVYVVVGSGIGEYDVWCSRYVACYICGKMWSNVFDHAVSYKLM